MPVCPQCDNRFFSTKEGLHQHIKNSSAWHPYCNICDRHFINQIGYDSHMAARHPPTFDCNSCNRTFHAQFALEDHYRGSPAHPNCAKCDRGFKNSHDCEEHHRTAHPRTSCRACGGVTMYEDLVDTHYLESPNHPSCTRCDPSVGFKDDQAYSEHIISTHPELHCGLCTRHFESVEAVLAHYNDSPRHPKCNICNSGFKDEQEHLDHMAVKHSPPLPAAPKTWGSLRKPSAPAELEPRLTDSVPFVSAKAPFRELIVSREAAPSPMLHLNMNYASPITEVKPPIFSPTYLPRPGRMVEEIWMSRDNREARSPLNAKLPSKPVPSTSQTGILYNTANSMAMGINYSRPEGLQYKSPQAQSLGAFQPLETAQAHSPNISLRHQAPPWYPSPQFTSENRLPISALSSPNFEWYTPKQANERRSDEPLHSPAPSTSSKIDAISPTLVPSLSSPTRLEFSPASKTTTSPTLTRGLDSPESKQALSPWITSRRPFALDSQPRWHQDSLYDDAPIPLTGEFLSLLDGKDGDAGSGTVTDLSISSPRTPRSSMSIVLAPTPRPESDVGSGRGSLPPCEPARASSPWTELEGVAPQFSGGKLPADQSAKDQAEKPGVLSSGKKRSALDWDWRAASNEYRSWKASRQIPDADGSYASLRRSSENPGSAKSRSPKSSESVAPRPRSRSPTPVKDDVEFSASTTPKSRSPSLRTPHDFSSIRSTGGHLKSPRELPSRPFLLARSDEVPGTVSTERVGRPLEGGRKIPTSRSLSRPSTPRIRTTIRSARSKSRVGLREGSPDMTESYSKLWVDEGPFSRLSASRAPPPTEPLQQEKATEPSSTLFPKITFNSTCASPSISARSRSPEVESPTGLAALPMVSPLPATPVDLPYPKALDAISPPKSPNSKARLEPVSPHSASADDPLAVSVSSVSSSPKSFTTSSQGPSREFPGLVEIYGPDEAHENPPSSSSGLSYHSTPSIGSPRDSRAKDSTLHQAASSPDIREAPADKSAATPDILLQATGHSSPTLTVSSSNPLHCRICRADVCNDITATMCGHIFCYDCITDRVIKTSRCPVCTTPTLLYCLFRIDLTV